MLFTGTIKINKARKSSVHTNNYTAIQNNGTDSTTPIGIIGLNGVQYKVQNLNSVPLYGAVKSLKDEDVV